MNVAVIGAGRNNNGIGPYIAKFFQKNNAEVTAVVGTTEKSARLAAEALEYDGRAPRHYTDMETLISEEVLDVAVIASPTATHLPYLQACIEAGLHIFCEKPFIDPDTVDVATRLRKIFADTTSKGLTVAMNSQCPFLLPEYERLCGRMLPEDAEHFSMNLSPMVAARDMIPDSVPHVLSLMYALLGAGEIEDLEIKKGDDQMVITGIYRARSSSCNFEIGLNRHLQQPRPFSFGWNHRVIHRRIRLEPYEISFQYGHLIRTVADPLELSVQNFLASIQKQAEPVIGRDHIIDTTVLLKQIFDQWETGA